jgi:signal transduction histidine kinase
MMNEFWMIVNSFRIRILGSFFVFVVISIIISIQVFWVWKSEMEIFKLNGLLSELKTRYLLTHKSEKDFLENELINQSFYANKQSKYIDDFNENIQTSIQNINYLKDNRLIEDETILKSFDTLQTLVDNYHKDFKNLVEIISARGFRDFGYEGKMRFHIHKLEEEFPQIDKLSILRLRRIEKDYLLRKDSTYPKKLLNSYENEKKKFSNQLDSQNIKIVFHLDNYYQNFSRIVAADNMIGNAGNEGLRLKLKNNTDKIEQLLNQTSVRTSAFMLNKTNYLFNILLITIFGCVITSLILAFRLTGIFAKPIIQLSTFIQKTVDNEFKIEENEIEEQTLNTTVTEFKKLEVQFRMMLNAIRASLLKIEEKNRILTSHNLTLESVNSILTETNIKLKQSEEELMQANNLKEKFLSIISHDLRGPLLTLKGFLSIIIESPEAINDNTKNEILNKIRLSVDLQLQLLSNMLQWAKAQFNIIMLNHEKINLLEELLLVVSLLEPTAEQKRIKIKVAIEPQIQVVSDKNIFELIVRNLISNAIKYSFEEGKILIYASDLDDYVKVSITDQGVGMTKEQILRSATLTINHSTDGTSNEKGTGFGLFFCKEFIEKNGGSMEIQSEINQGTTVSFTLKKVI